MRGICAFTLALPLAAGLVLHQQSTVSPRDLAAAVVVPFPVMQRVNERLETAASDARLGEMSNRLPNVRFLEVNLDGVSEWGLGELSRMKGLVFLALTGSGHAKVPAALAAVDNLPRLKGLTILGPARTLSDYQLEGVAALESLEVLQVGVLHETSSLSDRWLSYLPGLRNLRELEIVNTGLTGWGVEEIARLRGLQDLDLSQNKKLADGDFAPIARLENLQVLDLSRTAAGERATDAISELRRLNRLYLGDTAVTDAAIANLAYLENLHLLDLANTEITDRAVRTLTGMRRLDDLSVRGCDGLTSRGVETLRQQDYERFVAPGGSFGGI